MSTGEDTSHQRDVATSGDSVKKGFECGECFTHILHSTNIISKQFIGGQGRAFLVDKVENTVKGEEEDRELRTGTHTVADISCAQCNTMLGWVYVRAEAEDQKYKEGRYLIEEELLSQT